jgi:hypothetical protein
VWRLNISLVFSAQPQIAPSPFPYPGVIARYYYGSYSTYTSIEAAPTTSISTDTKGPLVQYDFASGATPMPSPIDNLSVNGRNAFAATFSGYIWNNGSSTIQVAFAGFFDQVAWLYLGVDKTNLFQNRLCSRFYGETCYPWSGGVRIGTDVYTTGPVDLTPGPNYFRFFLSNADGNQAYAGLWYSVNASGTMPTKDRRYLQPQFVSSNPCDISCLMTEPVSQQSGLLAKYYEYQAVGTQSLFRKNITQWPSVPAVRLVNQPDLRYCITWEGYITIPQANLGFISTFQVSKSCQGQCQTLLSIDGSSSDLSAVSPSSTFILEQDTISDAINLTRQFRKHHASSTIVRICVATLRLLVGHHDFFN